MTFRILLLVLLSALCVAAQSSVSVGNGSGDGSYRGQRLVDVWADPAPAGQLFDRWIGDTHLVERPDEWHSRIKTGTKTIGLTAVYRSVAAWTPLGPENIGTTQMRYFFPANAIGVVFHFHGSGGSMNGLFTSPEQSILARELVAEGYAVVALSSADRVNEQWSTAQFPNNPDGLNVGAAIDLFISRGLMTEQTPIFATGISNGGAFAPRVSANFGFRGTAIFIATSNATLMQLTNVPTIWAIMQNDTVLSPGSVPTAYANYEILRGRGIRAEINVLTPSPVFPERFRRIPGVSAADSRNIYDSLKTNGFLDRNDYLTANPNGSGWESVIPAQYSSILQQIFSQLKLCWTEHEYFSDFNRRVIRFFNQSIP